MNLADPDGISPMVLAIRNGHYDVAALLVEKGANVNAGDRVNRTPLYMAVDMHSLDWIQNRPAPKAEGALDSLDLVKLLLEKGAKPDAQLIGGAPGWKGDAIAAQNTFGNVIGAGTTPFVRAAKNGDLAVMRLLLDKGADPEHRHAQQDHRADGAGWRAGPEVRRRPAGVGRRGEERARGGQAAAGPRRGRERRQRGRPDARCTRPPRSAPTAWCASWWSAARSWTPRPGRAARALDEALRGVPNVDGAPGEAHEDTAALLRELMAQRGIDVKPAAPAAAAPAPAEP